MTPRQPVLVSATVSTFNAASIRGRSSHGDMIKILNETDNSTKGPQDLQQLSRIRGGLADLWLQTTERELPQLYAGKAGQLQREIMAGPLKDYPLSPGDRQKVGLCIEPIQKSPPGVSNVRYLLSAMLYLQPYELPGVQTVSLLPEWFQQDYLRFMLELPRGFRSEGIVDAWCGHLEKVMDQIHEGICRDPHAHLWQKLAFVFAEKAKLMPFYFVRKDLKRIFTLRASIVEFALNHRRYSLNQPFSNRPAGRKRLRLGIYCRAFVPYTETFATLPLFKHIDRAAIEVRLYVSRSDGNPFEMSVRKLSDTFTLLPDSIKESVQKIREDDLDILLFGNNVTANSGHAFLLANHRLARVQGLHFCNPVTSGQRHIDIFILGDQISGKIGERPNGFTERVLTMEGSGICFDIPEFHSSPESTVSRADLGVPDQSRLFISGANYFKITPQLRQLWARVIERVPGSVLVLYPFGPAWANEYPKKLFTDDLRAVFAEHGIPSSRLIVVDTLPGPDAIMALNRIADVYLDAVPYNGATSLLDPLRAGLAVVVADGGELRFAQGAAMLRELGMPELIAADEEEYVRLAVRLGSDDSLRHAVRERICERMRRTPDFLNPRLYGRRVSEALLGLFPDLQRGTGLEAATPKDCKVERSSVAL
jgi:predicted O-linked N-acetylglucosamine transferase (SPINDLY family)